MSVARSQPAPRMAVWRVPLIAAAVWAALLVAFLAVRPAGSDATVCVFRNVTGLPCPTCGSTRAVLAAAHGHLLAALAFNPLVVLAPVLWVAWMVARRGRPEPRPVSRRGRALLWLLGIAAVAGNWAWVIAHQRMAGS